MTDDSGDLMPASLMVNERWRRPAALILSVALLGLILAAAAGYFGARSDVDSSVAIGGMRQTLDRFEQDRAAQLALLEAGAASEAMSLEGARVAPALADLSAQLDALSRQAAGGGSDGVPGTIVIWMIGLGIAAALVLTLSRFRATATADDERRVELEQRVVTSTQLAERNAQEANHDPLTGLANRRQFMARLESSVRTVLSGSGTIEAVLIDLDRFKDINDTLGHHVGDRLLVEVAARFGRVVDELGRPGCLARLGGDEFAAFVVDLPEARGTAAARLAGSLHEALSAPFPLDGIAMSVGASIGIAVGPDHGSDASTLLRHADVAMYAAKRSGGGTVIYAPDEDPNSRFQLQLAAELPAALANGEIIAYYQPRLRLADNEVTSMEVLARWHHPRLGVLSADRFVPLVQRGGLGRQLTSRILSLAVRQAARWRAEGRELVVAINLSATDLVSGDAAAEIAGILARENVDGRLLRVEVTEEVLMTGSTRAAATIQALEDLGVRLSIDDFGTGYSSLAQLRRLSVDEIKIDRSFVADVATDPFDEAIVRSTVGLGRSLGMVVVAEGVDSAACVEKLRQLGCTEVQGHFILPPSAPGMVSVWLDERERRPTLDPNFNPLPDFTPPRGAARVLAHARRARALSGAVTASDDPRPRRAVVPAPTRR